MDISFDVEQLTVGDLEDLEEIVGASYEQIDFAKPSAKVIKALVYINGRHNDPAFTLEDARGVKVADMKFDVNPTKDGGAS